MLLQEAIDRRLIVIDKTGPNWHELRIEYISGNISLKRLSDKSGVPWSTLRSRAYKEQWGKEREATRTKIRQKAVKKTAEAAADNALIASRIRTKLLLKLEKEIDALPDLIGSETRNSFAEFEYQGKNNRPTKTTEHSKSFRIRELTAAYKDLTGDLTTTDNAGSELLQSLLDLERRVDHG